MPRKPLHHQRRRGNRHKRCFLDCSPECTDWWTRQARFHGHESFGCTWGGHPWREDDVLICFGNAARYRARKRGWSTRGMASGR